MPTPSNQAPRPAGQLALFFMLMILAALLLFFVMRAVTPLKEATKTPTPTPTSTVTPSAVAPKPTPSPAVPAPKPDGKTDTAPSTPTSTAPLARPQPARTFCDAQNFICVNTPLANDVITNPTVVTGTAIAFESTIQWKVKDAEGNTLVRGTATTNAPDIGLPGVFSVRAFWDVVPRTASGTVEVYESSARDGAPIHVVVIPVRFAQRTSVTRTLFFGPQVLNENDCPGVSDMSVSLPGTVVPIEQSLTALLAARSSDLSPGLKTFIPVGTRLVSLSVVNGLAKVVLSREFDQPTQSACEKEVVNAQIRKTLLRFPSVHQVDIGIAP